MIPVGGDPASISVLGGALRRHALHLVDLLDDLEPAATRMTRRRRGHPADTDGNHHSDHPAHHHGDPHRDERRDPVSRERDLITVTATELDTIGVLLQSIATESVENASRLRAIAVEAAPFGLVVEGRHIVETDGPSRADPGARLRARERLQDLLARVTSSDLKQRAVLGRALAASSAALARLSERARSGPG